MSDETPRSNDRSESATSSGAVDSSERSAGRLTPADVFRLLDKRRRRLALTVLRDHESPMTLADLADEVAIMERDEPITAIPAEHVKRVYMSLYHSHVPRLKDFGVVDYDQESDMISPTERITTVTAYLDVDVDAANVFD